MNPLSLCCVQRVTQYKVSWSRNGVKWNIIQDQQGNDKVCKLDANKPRSEKTGLRGLRPGPTKTGLCNHTRRLEA